MGNKWCNFWGEFWRAWVRLWPRLCPVTIYSQLNIFGFIFSCLLECHRFIFSWCFICSLYNLYVCLWPAAWGIWQCLESQHTQSLLSWTHRFHSKEHQEKHRVVLRPDFSASSDLLHPQPEVQSAYVQRICHLRPQRTPALPEKLCVWTSKFVQDSAFGRACSRRCLRYTHASTSSGRFWVKVRSDTGRLSDALRIS